MLLWYDVRLLVQPVAQICGTVVLSVATKSPTPAKLKRLLGQLILAIMAFSHPAESVTVVLMAAAELYSIN